MKTQLMASFPPLLSAPCASLARALQHAGPLVLLACAAAFSAVRSAHAAPPDLMTYQGFLVDGNGNPLATNAPANYPIVFRIYPSQTGGSSLWSEQQIVTVDKGNFSVLLGEGSSLGEPRPSLPSVFAGPNAAERYLSISVTLSGGSPDELLPRLRLLPSPYAFTAASATTLVNPNGNPVLGYANNRLEITGDLFASGNVNLGSTINAATLNVSGNASVGYLAVNAQTPGGIEGGEILLRGAGGAGNPDWAVDNFLNQIRFISGGATKFSVNGAGDVFVPGFLGVGVPAPTAKLHVNGLAKFDGASGVEFGAGVAGKELNAGRIGYQMFTPGALDIVGAGTTGANRRVRIWAEGGTEFAGGVTAEGVVTAGGGVVANGNLTAHGAVRARGGAPGPIGAFNNGFAFEGNGGDNDSGMFSSADGQVEFYAQGAEQMRINGSGNIGIGTSAPTARLDINGDVKIKGERPFAFKAFTAAGPAFINTGWPTNRYVVSVAGFSAGGGDILESGELGNLIVVKAIPGLPGNANWHIQADFRTHNGQETWTVTAMRMVRELVTDDSTF